MPRITDYDYKSVKVREDEAEEYIEGYKCFGWEQNRDFPKQEPDAEMVTLHFRRDKKILNRMELTRLQKNFEGCMQDIVKLQREKRKSSTEWALLFAFIGTVFMAGSVFAVVATPPIIWLCVLLAIPGFFGWLIAPFVFRYMEKVNEKKYAPLVSNKRDEITVLKDRGRSLL